MDFSTSTVDFSQTSHGGLGEGGGGGTQHAYACAYTYAYVFVCEKQFCHHNVTKTLQYHKPP